jgi:predicted nucleotidyltransferase
MFRCWHRQSKILNGLPMNLMPEQQQSIALWAASIEWVKEVRLFGSRAKGQSRPDSNVDLALTVVKEGIEDDDPAGFYYYKWAEWGRQLTRLLRLGAHVFWHDEEEEPAIYRYCQEASVLLYSRKT